MQEPTHSQILHRIHGPITRVIREVEEQVARAESEKEEWDIREIERRAMLRSVGQASSDLVRNLEGCVLLPKDLTVEQVRERIRAQWPELVTISIDHPVKIEGHGQWFPAPSAVPERAEIGSVVEFRHSCAEFQGIVLNRKGDTLCIGVIGYSEMFIANQAEVRVVPPGAFLSLVRDSANHPRTGTIAPKPAEARSIRMIRSDMTAEEMTKAVQTVNPSFVVVETTEQFLLVPRDASSDDTIALLREAVPHVVQELEGAEPSPGRRALIARLRDSMHKCDIAETALMTAKAKLKTAESDRAELVAHVNELEKRKTQVPSEPLSEGEVYVPVTDYYFVRGELHVKQSALHTSKGFEIEPLRMQWMNEQLSEACKLIETEVPASPMATKLVCLVSDVSHYINSRRFPEPKYKTPAPKDECHPLPDPVEPPIADLRRAVYLMAELDPVLSAFTSERVAIGEVFKYTLNEFARLWPVGYERIRKEMEGAPRAKAMQASIAPGCPDEVCHVFADKLERDGGGLRWAFDVVEAIEFAIFAFNKGVLAKRTSKELIRMFLEDEITKEDRDALVESKPSLFREIKKILGIDPHQATKALLGLSPETKVEEFELKEREAQPILQKHHHGAVVEGFPGDLKGPKRKRSVANTALHPEDARDAVTKVWVFYLDGQHHKHGRPIITGKEVAALVTNNDLVKTSFAIFLDGPGNDPDIQVYSSVPSIDDESVLDLPTDLSQLAHEPNFYSVPAATFGSGSGPVPHGTRAYVLDGIRFVVTSPVPGTWPVDIRSLKDWHRIPPEEKLQFIHSTYGATTLMDSSIIELAPTGDIPHLRRYGAGERQAIHVNNSRFETPLPWMTGAQIKALAAVPDGYELYKCKGLVTVPVPDVEEVDLREYLHFRAIPAGTFGHTLGKPPGPDAPARPSDGKRREQG